MTNNAKKQGRLPRPTSDSVAGPYKTPEAQAIDKWFEDLSLYEGTMSQLNSAPLDEAFKEELKAIQQWFNVLSEQERMTALFSLLKNLSIDQVRFFMTLLQLMISKDMVGLGVSMHQHPASQGGNEPMSKSAVEPIMPKLNKKVSNLSITTSLTGMPGPHSADPILGPESKFLAGTQKANGDAPGDSYFGVLSPMLPSAPVRPSRRLYDRHSNSNMEESFGQALAEARSEQFSSLGRESTRTPRLEGTEESPYSLPFSPNPLNGAPGLSAPSVSLPPPSIMRPSTPADEAISSADWSVPRKGSPAIGSLASPFTVPGPSPSLGAQSVPSSTRPTSTSQILAATPPNGYLSSASPKALGGGSPQPPPSMASVTTSNKSPSTPIDYSAMSLATPSYGMPELTDMRAFPSLSGSSPQPPAPPSQTSYSSSHSTLPSALDMSRRPPSTSFSAGKSPASPGASRYQYEQSDEDGSEGGAFTHRRQDTGLSSGGSVVGIGGGGHKEKGKIPESIDMALINDIPTWLRSLRLHKYTPLFERMTWKEMVKLTDQDLIDRGVAALGARRKMIKVFEMVRSESKGPPPPI